MNPVNLRSFKQKARHQKLALKRFLSKVEKNPPEKLYSLMHALDKEVWKEIDCLSCANCCKTMTPTFTFKDIKRIAAYLNMSPAAFRKKWLTYEKRDKDWVNSKQPCQFLDLQTNKCTIYPVRPADCAGFPHFKKKQPDLYMHVHQQNITYCPATFLLVKKMKDRLDKVSVTAS